MKIKISEATPLQLNWLVAKCEGFQAAQIKANGPVHLFRTVGYEPTSYEPSWKWEQGGPIIEREKIELIHYGSMGYKGAWEAQIGQDTHYIDQSPGDAIHGPTPLIAAMRCYVTSKMGDEVDVPEELVCPKAS